MEKIFTYDNYVYDPTCQQGFNRYAYCFYNPLKYIDPTGERCYGFTNGTGVADYIVMQERIALWNHLVEWQNLRGQYVEYLLFSMGNNLSGIGISSSSSPSGKNVMNFSTNGYDPTIVFPNNRDFSNYSEKEQLITESLIRNIKFWWNIQKGDIGIQNITTAPPPDYYVGEDGMFVNEENSNDRTLGQVIRVEEGKCISNVYISPFVATNDNIEFFMAVTSHELTHAYHFSVMTNVIGDYTEKIAMQAAEMQFRWPVNLVKCSSMTDMELKETLVPNRKYYVPEKYSFSTINFVKDYILNLEQ